jgi:hypothetical protein
MGSLASSAIPLHSCKPICQHRITRFGTLMDGVRLRTTLKKKGILVLEMKELEF